MDEAPGRDDAGVRFPPPLVFLGFLLLGPLLGRLIGDPGFSLDPSLRRIIGGIVAVAGTAIVIGATRGFAAAGTRPEPWKPSTAIVATGLYRHSRNPMYLGMATMTLGLAVVIDSFTAVLLLPFAAIAIRYAVIAREEAYLTAKFGATYRAYQAEVPRWL